MQYLMTMHQANRIKQITNYERSTLLRESLPTRNNIVELSIAAQLQHSVEILLVTEIAIGFDYVGVV